MKKRMSLGAVYLQMTWLGAAVFILAMCLVQLWKFVHLPMNVDSNLFEMMLDEIIGPAHWGKYLMMAALIVPMALTKSRYDYAMNRLRISEGQSFAIWSAVCGGYFLLSWGAQLATALGLLASYMARRPMDAMDLFLAANRSRYFHTLLPYGEPLAWARNFAMCLSYGTLTANFPWMLRNRKVWIGVVFLVVLELYAPRQMGQPGQDALLIGCLPALALMLYLARKWVQSDEDSL